MVTHLAYEHFLVKVYGQIKETLKLLADEFLILLLELETVRMILHALVLLRLALYLAQAVCLILI